MKIEKYYTPKEACEMLNIHFRTLQNWDRDGKIKIHRTPTNRRHVPESEILRILGIVNPDEDKYTIAYGRVSSYDQKKKGDLDRQVDYMVERLTEKNYQNIKVVTDVGSGLNDYRKGLLKIMDMAKRGEVKSVAVTYRDRLTRFGFNYLETYFASYDVNLIVLHHHSEDKSPQEELVEDLMSIIASFSGKLYGLRSGKNKKVTKKVKGVILDAFDLSDEDRR